jgi:hypothetical protein
VICAIDKEGRMAIARVVTFEGVSSERMAEMQREMEGREQPEGVSATEFIVLHDPEAEKSVVILFFDSEEDYTRSDKALNAMSSDDVPGRRTSVGKYDVAARMTTLVGDGRREGAHLPPAVRDVTRRRPAASATRSPRRSAR